MAVDKGLFRSQQPAEAVLSLEGGSAEQGPENPQCCPGTASLSSRARAMRARLPATEEALLMLEHTYCQDTQPKLLLFVISHAGAIRLLDATGQHFREGLQDVQ
ncbi:hypothetical protein NDU88_001262 [Pleurodeles waltl]|uniref:Uncharacterized protein n=1 Tax=Pleurodeles waltl TaxID=8319 RepID=A0AAV7THD2_PLEWA|nr:hypothetical protein NDU88_001262 [Pleurodeles waltl]